MMSDDREKGSKEGNKFQREGGFQKLKYVRAKFVRAVNEQRDSTRVDIVNTMSY